MKILGIGTELPGEPVSTVALAQRFGYDGAHLLKRPGVVTRHYCEDDQVLMGKRAALRALAEAGCGINDVDMIISACAVPYQPIPSMSSLYCEVLNARPGQVETLDINTTCLSFLSALDMASMMLDAGRCGRILIISSERGSRGLPWVHDPECAAHFGDGAAAFLVGPGRGGVVASKFRTYSGWESCQLRSGGTAIAYEDTDAFEEGRFFKMNGPELFKLTLASLPEFFDDVLARAGWKKEDVDCVVPHQASPLAIRHMSRVLGLTCPVVDIAARVGNQIAASIPTAFHAGRSLGVVGTGKKIIMLGTSAGVSFGAMAFEGEVA